MSPLTEKIPTACLFQVYLKGISAGSAVMNMWCSIHQNTEDQKDLVVVVEKAQGVGAVLVPVDAHHGLGGGRQRVLQV